MTDLWTLLVVDLFQGFWPAVLGIAFLIWIIFVVGKVSQLTSLNFISIFILAMAIGYGYSLIAIFTTIMIFVMQLLIIPRLVNS